LIRAVVSSDVFVCKVKHKCITVIAGLNSSILTIRSCYSFHPSIETENSKWMEAHTWSNSTSVPLLYHLLLASVWPIVVVFLVQNESILDLYIKFWLKNIKNIKLTQCFLILLELSCALFIFFKPLLTSLCFVTVIPVLFQNTLCAPNDDPNVTIDHLFGADPIKIKSPATDMEVSLALRVLDGCCLMYNRCASQAQKFKAIKVHTLLRNKLFNTKSGIRALLVVYIYATWICK
jgi:hypothetical protein